MPIRCTRGSRAHYRVRTTKKGKVRLGGCKKGNRFRVKEAKRI